jgi:hypothetical protein
VILQLEDGAVALLSKAIEEEGLEICSEGMQKHRTVDEYVQACEFRFGIMHTGGGSKERRPTQRLGHLRTTRTRTWQSSASSSCMFALD